MSYSPFNNGKYLVTPPTLTDGQSSAVQLDVHGNQKVAVVGSVGVTGTFWQTTQPVSGTVGISGTVPVSGTFFQSTQPVSIASAVAVTGTFWQTTQPVSGTVSVTQGTSPWVTSFSAPQHVIVDSGGGGGTQYAQGATASTPTGTVAMGKDSSNIIKALSLDSSGNLNINIAGGSAGNPAAGATGSTVPTSASYSGINISGNLVGNTGFALGATTKAASVAIVDGSGAQITSFGGGTQYTTGSAQATPVGTVALGWDGTDVRALNVDSSGNLLIASAVSVVSAANSTTTLPSSGAAFTGTGESTLGYAAILVNYASDLTAPFALEVEFSPDNSNWFIALSEGVEGQVAVYTVPVLAEYFRVIFSRGTGGTGTYLRLQTIKMVTTPDLTSVPIGSTPGTGTFGGYITPVGFIDPTSGSYETPVMFHIAGVGTSTVPTSVLPTSLFSAVTGYSAYIDNTIIAGSGTVPGQGNLFVTGASGKFPIYSGTTSITNTTGALDVNIKSSSGSVTVAQATAANLNATVVGTGTFAVQAAQATAASLNATVVGTGTFAVQAAQSGSWTVAATQSGTWNTRIFGNGGATMDVLVGGGTASTNALQVAGIYNSSPITLSSGQSAGIQVDANGYQKMVVQGTVAISASALPLPTGAATAAKQPALGTAGTPSTDVITVQGRSGMTALLVDGSAVTQPISGTVSIASDGSTGSSVPGTAIYVAGNKSGNLTGLLLDASGNLNVNVAAGGGAGGTSSSFAATFPSTGTAMGATDGTNMQPLKVDGSANLHVGIWSGTTQATVKAASTAPATTDPALVVSISPNTPVLPVSQSGTWTVGLSASQSVFSKLQDGSGVGITSNTRGSAQALAVEILDAGGSQITSFGGTQYATGASQATPTGTVALGWDSSNVRALSTTSTGALNVVSATASNFNTKAVIVDSNAASITATGGSLNIRPGAPTTQQYTKKFGTTSSSGATVLVTGVASQTIRVYKVNLVVGAATNISFLDSTPTTLSATYILTGNGASFADFAMGEPLWVGASGKSFEVTSSSAVTLNYELWYTIS